jgi:hypothetical protein
MGAEAVKIDPLVHAAFLAGRGHSAEEIATAVGARSGETISAALSLYELKLDRKPFGERLVGVRVNRDHHAALEAAARVRDVDVPEVLRRIVAVVGRGDVSVDGLLDDRAG